MRDDHRPKQELIQEITGLRKQVVDLKEAMTARRRVEDALRTAEALLRNLADGAPVGLGLFSLDGTLLTANRPFARMLGYDSPAELQALAAVFGVFASPEEQSRTLGSAGASGAPHEALFRRKDGCRRTHSVLAGESPGEQAVTLAVFDVSPDRLNPPFRTTSA
jgi:PAS domain S-box-containing protein